MNKLIPVLMALVVSALGGTLWWATREAAPAKAYTAEDAQPGKPAVRGTGRAGDRDSPLETIESLTQMQARMQKALDAERHQNRNIRQRIDALVANGIQDTFKSETQAMRAKFNAELARLTQQIPKGGGKAGAQAGRALDGLGFDDLPVGGAQDPAKHGKRGSAWISVQPVTALPPAGGKAQTGLLNDFSDVDGLDQATKKAAAKAKPSGRGPTPAKPAATPRYTIPDTATLVQNTTLTALLGRVPISNAVTDPFRFKVMTGPENLAANGHRLPEGVVNIVWTGWAIGNRELSCVSGFLDTVSLVFEDGRIADTTVKRTGSTEQSTRRYLGYITDPRGKPCLEGLLFSNASDYLQDRIVLAALSGAAKGVAASQSATIRNPTSGQRETVFDGELGELILGQTFSGGLDEAAEYLKERMRDAFDVVYVGTGLDVSIHVEQTIAFDDDPTQRKLDYAQTTTSQRRLD